MLTISSFAKKPKEISKQSEIQNVLNILIMKYLKTIRKREISDKKASKPAQASSRLERRVDLRIKGFSVFTDCLN